MSSKLVDQRVVEMQFDNRNFERNVNESIKSIDKLKMSLDFSAVEVAAVTAISNITNKITDMGLNLAKSLSIDQLTSGWAKYESKSKSVGTLLAQGLGIEEVNNAVEKLQWFTDETSYSFQEMFNNMTKFTSAGRSIEEAGKAVEGMADWAALTGQNAQVASQAMYQLTQAIGSGYIKYQDWQQGVVNKNMVSTVIQEFIADVATSMTEGESTLVKFTNDAMETFYKTADGTELKLQELFGHNLTDKLWLTSDIFIEAMARLSSASEPIKDIEDTLDIMAADAAQLAKTFQGDISTLDYEKLAEEYDITAENIEKLRELSIKYNNTLDAQAINAFIAAQECRTLGDAVGAVREAVSSNWSKIWENIFGDYITSKKLWTDLNDSLYNVFVTPMEKMAAITEEWKKSGGWNDLFGIDRDNDTYGALWNILYTLEDIIHVVRESWNKVFKQGANAFKNFTEKLKEGTAYLRLSHDTLNTIGKAITLVFKLINKVVTLIKKLFNSLGPLFKVILNLVDLLLDGLGKLFNDIENFVTTNEYVLDFFQSINDVFQDIIENIRKLTEEFKKFFTENGENITSGVTKGIEKSKKNTRKAVVLFAEDIQKDFNKTLRINSPSLVMEKSGEYVVQGVEKGINKESSSLKESIVKLGSSILETFVKSLEIILEGINWLIPHITKFIDKLGETFKKLGETFTKFINDLNKTKEAPDTYFKGIIKFVESTLSIFKAIYTVVSYIFSKILDLFEFVGATLEKSADNMKEKDSLFGLFESLKNLFTAILSIGKPIVIFITNFFNNLVNIINGVTGNAEENLEGNSPLLNFLNSIIDFFNSILELLGQILPIVTRIIGSVTDAIKNLLSEESKESIFTAVSNFISSIFTIIKNIINLMHEFIVNVSKSVENNKIIKDVQKFMSNEGPVLIVIGILTFLVAKFSTLGRLFSMLISFTKSFDSILALSSALAMFARMKAIELLFEGIAKLATALTLISILNWGNVLKGTVILSTMFGIIIAAIIIISKQLVELKTVEVIKKKSKFFTDIKSANTNLTQISVVILSISTSMLLFSMAISNISRVLTKKTGEKTYQYIIRIVSTMAIFILSMFILVKAVTKIATSTTVMTENLAPSILMITGAIGILTESIKILTRTLAIYGPGAVWQAFGMLTAFMVIIVAMIIALNKYTDMYTQVNQHNQEKRKPTFLANEIIKLAASLLIISVSISVLAAACYKFGGPAMWQAFGAITAVLVIMGGMSAALTTLVSSLSRNIDTAKFEKATNYMKELNGFLLSIGASILMIGATVALLAFTLKEAKLGNVIGSVLIIGGIIAACSYLAYVIADDSKDLQKLKDANLKNIAGDLFILTAVIGALSIVLAALALANKYIGFGNMVAALIMLGAIVTGVIFLVREMSKLEKISKIDFAGLMSVFISIAGLIAVMVASLIILAEWWNKMPGSMIGAIIEMAAILIAITVLPSLFNEMNKGGVDTWQNTLIKFVPILVMLAAMVGAFVILAEVSKTMNIKAMLVSVLIIGALGGLVVGLVFLSKAAKGIEWTALGKLAAISGILLILVGAFSLMVAAINKMSGILSNPEAIKNFAIIMGILTTAVGLMVVLGALGTYVGPGLLAISTAMLILSTSVLLLGKALETFLNVFTLFADTGSSEIVSSFHNLVQGIKGAIDDFKDLLGIAATLILEFFSSLLESAITWFDEGGKDQIKELIKKIFITLAEGLITGILVIASYAGQIIAAIMTLIKEINKALGVEASFDDKLTPTEYLSKSATQFLLLSIAGMIEGIAAGLPSLGTSLKILVDALLDFISQFLMDLGEALYNKAGKLKAGIDSLRKGLRHLLLTIIFGEDMANEIEKIGGNLIEGLKKGINIGINKLKETITDSGGKVINWFKDVLGINSPSKLTEEMGKYLDEGLALGIKESQNIPIKSADELASNVSSAIAEVADAMNSDLSQEDLTIRPVLDLTEIQNGTAQMANMLNGVDASVKTNLNNANYASREFNNNKQNVPSYATSEDITRLSDTMNGGGDIINATFNITGNNPEEIAKEVEKVMENQILRRNINKGGLTSL